MYTAGFFFSLFALHVGGTFSNSQVKYMFTCNISRLG